MKSHDLALLLLEWPNAETMVEYNEEYYPIYDVETDLEGSIHFTVRTQD